MTFRSLLVPLVAVTGLVLAGCSSSGGDAGEAVTLEVQTGLAVDGAELTALQKVTDAFNDANPDIHVELMPGTPNYENDIKVRLAAGDVPDIFQTHGWSRDRYGEFLAPLDEEPWASSIAPSLVNSMTDSDGHIYAMPTNVDINGMLVSFDVLDEVGVAPEDIDTWDDFAEASDAILAEGISPIVTGGKDMAAPILGRLMFGAFDDAELEQMAGGEFVADAFQSGLDVVDGWRQADYFNPDYSSASRTTMSDALAQGLAAFAFGPSAILQDALLVNPDANLGFIPVPSLQGDGGYLAGGERTAFGVSTDSPNVEQAKTYLRFLAEEDNVAALAAASSSLPGIDGVDADLGALQSSYDLFVTPGDVPVMPHFDRVYLPNGAWSALGTVSDSVITGQSSPDEATAQMRDAYERLTKEADAS